MYDPICANVCAHVLNSLTSMSHPARVKGVAVAVSARRPSVTCVRASSLKRAVWGPVCETHTHTHRHTRYTHTHTHTHDTHRQPCLVLPSPHCARRRRWAQAWGQLSHCTQCAHTHTHTHTRTCPALCMRLHVMSRMRSVSQASAPALRQLSRATPARSAVLWSSYALPAHMYDTHTHTHTCSVNILHSCSVVMSLLCVYVQVYLCVCTCHSRKRSPTVGCTETASLIPPPTPLPRHSRKLHTHTHTHTWSGNKHSSGHHRAQCVPHMCGWSFLQLRKG